MVLSAEQIAEAKRQLSEQINHLPVGQREEAQEQIDSMDAGAIEEMVRQQQARSGAGEIFRAIAEKQVPSVIVDETAEAIAVLSIRPVSRGHALVIPKKVVKNKGEMPKGILDFAAEVGEKVNRNLGAKKTDVKLEQTFGEFILEVVPDYGKGVKKENEAEQVDASELEKVKTEINVIKIEKKVEKIKKAKEPKMEILKLRRRIP